VTTLLAEKPAAIYNLKDRGSLEKGKNADLTIVDFNAKFRIDASKFKSKAKFSPYHGWEVHGKVSKTIVSGNIVFDDGQIVAKAGSGSIVRGINV
jgi:dihydroorotase-like cyclic amidohydrolase